MKNLQIINLLKSENNHLSPSETWLLLNPEQLYVDFKRPYHQIKRI